MQSTYGDKAIIAVLWEILLYGQWYCLKIPLILPYICLLKDETLIKTMIVRNTSELSCSVSEGTRSVVFRGAI